LRDFGLEVAIEKHPARPTARHQELSSLSAGCE